MTELWRLAATDQSRAHDSDAADDTATRMLAAERDALEAEAKALQNLNQELQRHRATAEKSLAEARALLSRRDGALEEERSRAAGLEQALVQARMGLEILLERRRLGPARPSTAATRRKPTTRKRPPNRLANAKRRTRSKRPTAKQTVSRKLAKRAKRHKPPRDRRT
jgi:hypothetical protein